MKYEFDKNLRKVTVIADNFDDVLDIEELKRVGGIVDIMDVDYITRPLNKYSSPRIVVYTAREGGVTDLKDWISERKSKTADTETYED